MISMIAPLYVGNALRLWIEPPASAVRWRILRKGSDTFAGHDDPSALLVHDGNDKAMVDTNALRNDVMAFYKPYWTADAGATWTAGPTAFGTPAATYAEATTDVQACVRERLEAGLKVEVDRLNIQNDLGYVQCMTASPSMDQELRFPMVTVHLDYEEPSDRFLGEDLLGDSFDVVGDEFEDSDGWLADVGLTIVGWSLNGDERAELRRAIRRLVIGNLAVFEDKGFSQVNIKQQDVDAISGEYSAPVYQVMTTFTCKAPVRVGARTAAFTGDIDVNLIVRTPNGQGHP